METPVSGASGAPTPEEQPINPKLLLPKADSTLFDVGKAVETRWAQVPGLTLLWTTPAAYSTSLADFGSNQTEKRRISAERSPNVERLMELDDIADNALPFLKGYINEEAGTRAKGRTHYAAHGMVLGGKKQKVVEWADDREARVKGIEMLLTKLRTGGEGGKPLPYADRKFGEAFWDKWLAEYKPLVEKSGSDAGSVSHKVSKKDAAKKDVLKTLRAIIYLLKANYPDTFEAELRLWGFRKESY
jgi:hypothetical protein